jgi:NADH:ubiquinone oxidoreductase subunit E
MGLELEDIAEGEHVPPSALVELAEDRGRPASHYVAALALASDLRLAAPPGAKLTLRMCAGNCQRWGALDVVDHVLVKHPNVALEPVSCLDRCDLAPACELRGDHGVLVLAPAICVAIDEAIATL